MNLAALHLVEYENMLMFDSRIPVRNASERARIGDSGIKSGPCNNRCRGSRRIGTTILWARVSSHDDPSKEQHRCIVSRILSGKPTNRSHYSRLEALVKAASSMAIVLR